MSIYGTTDWPAYLTKSAASAQLIDFDAIDKAIEEMRKEGEKQYEARDQILEAMWQLGVLPVSPYKVKMLAEVEKKWSVRLPSPSIRDCKPMPLATEVPAND